MDSFTIFWISVDIPQVSYLILVYFAQTIFSLKIKNTKKYYIFLGILSILVILPNNYYGLSPDQQLWWGPNIRPFTMAAVLVLLSIINTRIIVQSRKFFTKTRVSHVKIGILCFMLAQFAELINFLCISIDTFLIFLLPQYTGYSAIFVVGFLFNSLYPVFMFLSQALPLWVWKRLKQKEPFSQYFDEQHVLHMSHKDGSITSLEQKLQPLEILITCPICQINQNLPITPSIVEQIRNKPSGMATIFVEKKMVCEHSFLCFVDKFLEPRGYQAVDVQFDKIPENSDNL